LTGATALVPSRETVFPFIIMANIDTAAIKAIKATAPKHKPLGHVLAGQKAIVTGASSGIGHGVAIALAQAGADVLINYASHEKQAEDVAREIEKLGRKAIIHRADVSCEPKVQQMFRRALKAFGAVDILINNAGIQKDAPIDQMTLEQWQGVIDINLTGQFLCAREAIREFRRRGVQREFRRRREKLFASVRCMN
jgi:glucose 1-dehydrogenase